MSYFNFTISWGISAFIVLVLLLAVIFHEIGHWLYIYRRRGVRMRFKLYKNKGLTNFGIRQFDDSGALSHLPLTDHELKNTLIFGIALGFLPVFFGWLALSKITILGWFMLPGYFAGCKRDFDKLIAIVKRETEGFQNGRIQG